MLVTRKMTAAGKVTPGNTFKYVPEDSGYYSDFLVMQRNNRFRLLNNTGIERRDTDKDVLVYNIGTKCFGVVPANQQVILTEAELIING